MSGLSEQAAPWNDIEMLLDAVRVEEEVQLAILEALGRAPKRRLFTPMWLVPYVIFPPASDPESV